MPRRANSAASDRASDRATALVDRIENPGAPTTSRNDVVRTTLAPFARSGAAFLHCEEGALEVDRELRVDELLRHSFQRSGNADASVHEQDVQAPVLVPDLIKDTIKLAARAQDRREAPYSVSDVARRSIQAPSIGARDNDLRPFRGKQLRGFKPDPRRAATLAVITIWQGRQGGDCEG